MPEVVWRRILGSDFSISHLLSRAKIAEGGFNEFDPLLPFSTLFPTAAL